MFLWQWAPANTGNARSNFGLRMQAPEAEPQVRLNPLAEMVADRGCHSSETVLAVQKSEARSYIPEPKRQRRKWARRRDALCYYAANIRARVVPAVNRRPTFRKGPNRSSSLLSQWFAR